jgi:hypothetical protein
VSAAVTSPTPKAPAPTNKAIRPLRLEKEEVSFIDVFL